MPTLLTIKYTLYEGGDTYTIPVLFRITNEGNTTIYNCKVDLPNDRIPAWLTVTEFQIPHYYTPGNPGVTATAFSEVRRMGNIDTILFVTEVETQISVSETNKELLGK